MSYRLTGDQMQKNLEIRPSLFCSVAQKLVLRLFLSVRRRTEVDFFMLELLAFGAEPIIMIRIIITLIAKLLASLLLSRLPT